MDPGISGDPSPLFQVIYKKTQLPCPLPFFFHNASVSANASEMMGFYQHNSSALAGVSHANMSPALLPSPGAHQPAAVPHADFEEMCTPKYFVFNSQVR